VRALGRRPPSHQCIFQRHYVCPSVPTQNERDGLAGWGWGRRRTYPPVWRSHQGRQWMTHVLGNCIRRLACAPSVRRCDVCHSMPFDMLAVDIKANTPLIRFVVDLLLVCCTWPSFCTQWRAQTIYWDALLACSSVYVASAAIGLVLGLVLGLNLGLGQLCMKVGAGRLCTLCTQAHSSH